MLRRFGSLIFAIAFVAILMPMARVVRAATLPACTSSITACCEITAAGTYIVTGALSSTDPAGDCIDVNAANVNLFDAGNAITGPGGSSATGIGINVMKKAKNANLMLTDPKPSNPNPPITFISGFGTGMEVAAQNSVIVGFSSESNEVSGLTLNSARNCDISAFDTDFNGIGILISAGSGCTVHDFDSDSNTTLGMSLSKTKNMTFFDFQTDDTTAGTGFAIDASSSNRISAFDADGNSVGGFSLNGKSTKNLFYNFQADSNTTGSGVTVQSSNSNQILDFDADDNGVYGLWLLASNTNTVRYFFTFGNKLAGVYLGCSSTGPANCSSSASSKNILTTGVSGNDGSIAQGWGVAVDTSDLKNSLTAIGASGNTTEDLLDNNANCATNVWTLTSADTASPSSCIATTP